MSPHIPYVPMHPPRKQVTQDEMWAKIAKHTKVDVHVRTETQSPKEKSAPIEWHKPVRTGEISGYVLSRCGRFSISKDSVGGKPMYTAWKRSKNQQVPATNLGVRPERKEAEHLCELESQRD